MNETLIYYVGGIMITVIGYFLRSTMDDLKATKQEVSELKNSIYSTRNKLDMVEAESNLKFNHLTEKIDELYEAIKVLTIEIKSLNSRIK